jgi:hypothetical protein
MFFSLRKRPSTNHDLPSIHHNFTTKTPRKNPAFSRTPLKNAHKTAEITLSRCPQFFLK